MPNKMERFTQRARRALGLAQEEAERLHHNSIGTEHLLLGLIRVDSGVAHQVFDDLIVTYAQLSMLVAKLSPMGQRTSDKALDLSAETKHVLERAVVEARNMNHNYIGMEHLLLALVYKPDAITTDILNRLQITTEDVRQSVDRILGRDKNVLRPVVTPLASRMRTYVSRAMSGPTPPNIEVMKILQLLEDGKITAQESEKLLQALPPTSASVLRPVILERSTDTKTDQMRLVITERASNNVRFDIRIPVDDGVLAALMTVQDVLTSSDVRDAIYRVDLFLYEADDDSGEEAS